MAKENKSEQLRKFMLANPHMSQKEVRDYFIERGIKVSSSEASQAALKAGLRSKSRTPKPRKQGPAGKVIKVPVAESPVMAGKVKLLRKRNEKLRHIIDFLLDEEVDSLADSTRN